MSPQFRFAPSVLCFDRTPGFVVTPPWCKFRLQYTAFMRLLLFTLALFGWLPAETVLAEDAQTRLINPVRDSYPQISPDGQYIVFQSNRDGSNQIWLMQRDGSDLRQLTHAAGEGAETPGWSPDGQFIVYAAYLAEGNNDVFIMRPDGSDQKQISNGPGYDGHPHWSADGQRIVFNSDRDTPEPDAAWHLRWHDIWSVAPDGSGATKLTNCKSTCTFGSVSPDGSQLLYRRVDNSPGLNWVLEAGDRNSEIYVVPLSGGEARNLSAHPAFDGWPQWSPDGQWVVFASNRTGPPLTGQVWLVRPDGSDLQQITQGSWAHVQPSFSPQGGSILVYRHVETDEGESGSIVEINH